MTSIVKRTGIRLTVLLTSFAIGTASYFVVHSQTILVSDIPTASAKRADDLHRFYEAAMLSGDADLRRGIVERLRCADAYHPWATQPDDPNLGLVCQRADEDLELGMDALLRSHERWIQQNMAFVREISTAERARAYALAHLE